MAEKLKIISLGGLNEIGKNLTVYEYGGDIIVVDVGMGFPDDEMYGIDVSRGITYNMPRAGVTPWKVTTYKRACEEGWAPAPTNEYQQAIWDKVHAVPTEPLKIKYQKPATGK